MDSQSSGSSLCWPHCPPPFVWAGTGADPSEAFRTPDLENSSLGADVTWKSEGPNDELGTIGSDQLALAWADAFALLERRSSGDSVDFLDRFHSSIADRLTAESSGTWLPFDVVSHDITLRFVSPDRQVVSLSVEVRRSISTLGAVDDLDIVETYETVMSNGDAGWILVTFNRVDSTHYER